MSSELLVFAADGHGSTGSVLVAGSNAREDFTLVIGFTTNALAFLVDAPLVFIGRGQVAFEVGLAWYDAFRVAAECLDVLGLRDAFTILGATAIGDAVPVGAYFVALALARLRALGHTCTR